MMQRNARKRTCHCSTRLKTNVTTSFWPVVFARFCAALTRHLKLGLSQEQLKSLYRELLEIAYYNNDIHLRIYLKELISLKIIPADIHLNEILLSYMALEEQELDKLSYFKICLKRAKENGDKRAEMKAYLVIGSLNVNCNQYYDAIVYNKNCLAIAEEIGDKRAAMNSYFLLGRTYRDVNLEDDAIAHCKKCIDIANDLDEKKIKMVACFVVGKLYFYKGNYEEAFLCSQSSLQAAKEICDKKYELMVYLLIQDCQYHLGEYKEAAVTGQKSIAIAKHIGDEFGENAAYLILANTYESLNQFEDAINCRTKSIEMANETDDMISVMDGYLRLANSYYLMRQFDSAIAFVMKALDMTTDNVVQNITMKAYLLLGNIYNALEKFENSVMFLKKCFTNSDMQSDKTIELELQAHFVLGKSYRSLNQYNEAIESLKKCLVIAWKIGDKHVQKDVYAEIGNIYEFMNRFDLAIRFGKKLLEVVKEIGDEDDLMDAYLALGIAYLGLDKYDDTFSSLNEGLEIAKQREDTLNIEQFNDHLKNLYKRVETLGKATNFDAFIACGHPCLALLKEDSDQQDDKFNKGRFFLEQYSSHRINDDYEQAIVCLKQHLCLFERCAHYHGNDKVYCLLEIAAMYTYLDQYEESLKCYQESLAIAIDIDVKHLQAICYSRQGETYQKLDQLKEAENSFRKSIRSFETMFTGLGGEEFKILLLDSYAHCFKRLAHVFFRSKQPEKALVVLDRSRARTLNGFLQNFGINKGIKEEHDLEYKDIETLVAQNKCSTFVFYSFIDELMDVFMIDSEKKLKFSAQILGCSCGRNESFEMKINKAFDELEVWNYVADNCENRSLDEPLFEANVNHPGEKRNLADSVKPDLSKQCRTPVVKKKKSTKTKKCKESATGLEQLQQLLLRCDKMYCITQEDSIALTRNVKYLGQTEKSELVIIPDGPFYKVPFAVLRDPDTGQYLSETKRIRLVPSLATLKVLQERQFASDYSKKGALVIGDPLVGKVMFNGKETEFPPLDNAFCEALAVSSLLYVTPLTRETATKSAVIERLLQGVSVVHIAAHGSPTKGTIALAPSPEIRATKIPDEEDYMLTMADVQKAQVRAQLVVLSCCHSGRGEIRSEGVVGMCRAFLASGARAVVASLWAIDDEATLEFMTKFYLNLRDKKSASESLQQAMKEMRNSTNYNKPKYWAPFFLMGDDVTIKF